jgi:NADH-quinone oxidoreductase subunit C
VHLDTAAGWPDSVTHEKRKVRQAIDGVEWEAYDLYGILFEGRPDLRHILMWNEFTDIPMRMDYVEPDDYEYEPTPHDDVLEKAQRHFPGEGAG